MTTSDLEFGLPRHVPADLRRLFDRTPGLRTVWIYGSRARGDAKETSDIDLAIDAPALGDAEFAALVTAIDGLPTLYRIDAVRWQELEAGTYRDEIERDRKPLWAPRRHAADAGALGATATTLKPFQTQVLGRLGLFLDELARQRAKAESQLAKLRAMEDMEEFARQAADFPRHAWDALRQAGALPPAFAAQAHSSRFDGAGRAIPNLCLKVPTGGGKTLLAAAGVARVHASYLQRHTGLVLWVVPNEAIYRQTLKTLTDRDHPYRQMLNVAGAGRVKILEKQSPLTRLDVESHLCVMLLMLQSAARQSKETLRFFRDRGNVLGFLPREDDIDAHWALLDAVPNLDVYGAWGQSAEQARAQKGSIVKSSLGNVMRLLRPMVVIDEGHHAYSENALRTIDGFNPSFMLELSATPRVAGVRGAGSNILVDVRGTDLDEAEMIKLPIHVDVRGWSDWQSCLGAAVQRLDDLQHEAALLQAETARYLRPILLVQVERTGADLRDAGFIHAEDAKAHLLQLGFHERQIAIKTSERDDLKQPENVDLLSPACEIRVIVTKQALQEGWDCPFAYVLCALAAGRNPAAMTQLVGRILRQPQTAKTGRAALDACYVLCHDAKTADVVRSIKTSLETEGMGDLAVQVRAEDATTAAASRIRLRRRPALRELRLFLPRVTWAEEGATRRELVYDSDVLSRVPWQRIDAAALAADWAPSREATGAQHFAIDLGILRAQARIDAPEAAPIDRRVDRARLVRALLDLAPNAWMVWDWVDAVIARLLGLGHAESAIAASTASLIERLRVDVETQRDALAQGVFDDLVKAGRIEFRLRADRTDYELPREAEVASAGAPEALIRPDGRPAEKSLLEPALKLPGDNRLELDFACYLDAKAALRWWHRNVAKTQYGLQGWRRDKVYPDFVFARVKAGDRSEFVVMETKGLQLAGSGDTAYKQALLSQLSAAYRDERVTRAGEFAFGVDSERVVCDLVIDEAWQGRVDARYFAET